MSRDATFHIKADVDHMIRQLRQLHSELNTLGRAYRRHDRQLDPAVKRNRGPQPAHSWRWRKGQARR